MFRTSRLTYPIMAAIVFALIAVIVFSSNVSGGAVCRAAAFAEASEDNVLTDFENDSAFNAAEYPVRQGDYSLKVVQLAESGQGELFVYVYHPSADIRTAATHLSLAEQMNNADNFRPVLYSLELIENSQTLYKYRVQGFNVSNAAERFYNVIMIQRNYLYQLDGASGGITDRKAYGVGQYWKAVSKGDSISYKMKTVDVVEIIDPFASYIRKNTGLGVNQYYHDNYYVAFSTNRSIDELLSATVCYRMRDYYYKENGVLGFDDTEFNKKAFFTNEKVLSDDVYCDEVIEMQYHGTNLFGIFDLDKNYSWRRIQSANDFVNNSGASSSDKDTVKALQWVLMFSEVSVYRYDDNGLISRVEEVGQIIDNVTVLRLEFVEDGVTYNLGTVSDTVSGEHNFGGNFGDGNTDNGKMGFWAYLWHCIKQLFTGKASGVEIFVAVIVLVVIVIAVVFAVKFILWAVKGKRRQ